VLEVPAQLDDVRRELDLYFEGKLDRFDLPLDWQLSDGFQLAVQHGIARIPFGETRTYTEMAKEAGNERAVRAAGTACGRNPIPLVVPCHRVLRTSGALGGYGGGLPMKRGLLELEGSLDR
jgi:methylated-DNA-[protein]-cysteine S-methyltransferase